MFSIWAITMFAVTLPIIVSVRSTVVYTVRVGILYTGEPLECNALHNMLPTYDYMVWHPSQWLLWTKKQYLSKYCA